MSDYARNVRRVLESATDEEWEQGIAWYDNANLFARSVAEMTGYTTSQVAGVIAALSPQVEWERNKRIAIKFCNGQVTRDQTLANNLKAQRILDGESPETALASKWGYHKTLSFYRCIMGDWQSVCLDRHAAHIATGKPNTSVRYSNYERIANAYREVAKEYDIHPAQAQAIAWVTWRNHDKEYAG